VVLYLGTSSAVSRNMPQHVGPHVQSILGISNCDQAGSRTAGFTSLRLNDLRQAAAFGESEPPMRRASSGHGGIATLANRRPSIGNEITTQQSGSQAVCRLFNDAAVGGGMWMPPGHQPSCCFCLEALSNQSLSHYCPLFSSPGLPTAKEDADRTQIARFELLLLVVRRQECSYGLRLTGERSFIKHI